MTPQLIEYIKAALASGQSREAVTLALVQNGWKTEDIQQGFADVAIQAPVVASSPSTPSNLPLFLIAGTVLGIVIVSGGLLLISPQTKNNDTNIAGTIPVTATTTTENIVLDDTTLASSSGTAPKITGSITIDNKLTFTSTQLSNLKTDLIKLYTKYNGQDKNVEPLKTQFGKELNAIFLKDLGVADVTTTNMGILLYPEIGSIMADIQKQFGTPKSPANTAPSPSSNTTNSGMVISKVYVSGADIIIDGQNLLSVTKIDIPMSKCIYYGNDKGFQEIDSDTKITLAGYAQCLPSTDPSVSITYNDGPIMTGLQGVWNVQR